MKINKLLWIVYSLGTPESSNPFYHGLQVIIGSLSKDVFERRTSTGSEAFSLFIRLDTTKFVLLSFFSQIKTIYLRVSTKPQPNAAKSPLPVDVRRSKTLLLKLPNEMQTPLEPLSAAAIECFHSRRWPASMQIYWNERKRLHKERV